MSDGNGLLVMGTEMGTHFLAWGDTHGLSERGVKHLQFSMTFPFFCKKRAVLQSSNQHHPRVRRPWFRKTFLRVPAALCAEVYPSGPKPCSVFSPPRLQWRNAQQKPLLIFYQAALLCITLNPLWVVYSCVFFFSLQILKGKSVI